MFKSKLFFQVVMATLVATLATVGIVAATTTIGTSINTGGTLTVTSTTATSTISTGGLTVGTNQFVVQQTSGNVGIGTNTPSSKLDVQGDVSTATLGDELVSDTSGTACSADGDCVTKSVSVVSGTDYVVEWNQTHSVANNGSVTPYIDTTAGTALMWGDTSAHTDQQQIITAATTGTTNLIYKVSGFTSGTITLANVSLKAITAANPAQQIFNSDGSKALEIYSGGSGLSNTFMGSGAGRYNFKVTGNTGQFNSALGYQALYRNTTGYANTAIGNQVLYRNTIGYFNIAMGHKSLYSNTTGIDNTAIGGVVLYSNTTGIYNSGVGYSALFSNTTGLNNTAMGNSALYFNTTGADNATMGVAALYKNITGSENVVMGNLALYFNSSATSSTAVGYKAGFGITGSTYSQNNVFLGYKSGYGNTTGNNNTLLGYQSGYSLSSGSSNIIIGYNVAATSSTATGQLNIGNVLFGTGMYGGSSVSGTPVVGAMIGIGTSSPASLLHVSAGTNATTTVEFGAQAITSKTCFNVRDALGAATSFYFVGTAMVVEPNRCR